jgi:hypothetical protein
MTAAAADRVQVIGAWDKPAGRQARLCGRDLVQVRYTLESTSPLS